MKPRHASHSIRLLAWVSSVVCSISVTDAAASPRSLERAMWTKVEAPPAAVARAAGVFVYDQARENCVVFGGRPVDDRGSSLEDTGLWSRDTWVPVAAEYGRRGYVTGVFDSRRRRTVVYGGSDGGFFFRDTWEFDGSAWTRQDTESPGHRNGHGLAYDSRRQVTVLFGGYDGFSWKDEVWEWDGDAWTQGCTEERCLASPRPAARSRSVFVFDEARGVSVLFGGVTKDGESFDDTWSWDGERWQELHPNDPPLARHSAAATYDPVSKRVLLFGGVAAGLQALGDFWAWDGKDWTNIAQTSMPFARHGAGMAWHARDRRGILFGGSASGQAADVWEFKLLGSPCETREDCHDGLCVKHACSTEPGLILGEGGGSSSEGGSSNEGGGPNEGGRANEGGRSNEGGSPNEGGSSTGGESSSGTGGVAGQATGGGSASSAAITGGAGQGGKEATTNEGGVGVTSGTSAMGDGVAGADAAHALAQDPPEARRNFYSCAFSGLSNAAGGSAATVLAIFVGWRLRRRRRG
jgi:hypothetical protein